LSNSNQLIFDFECHPALSRDSFLIAENNLNAVQWIDKWPDWPSPVLCLFGPSGCGKTHLAQVFKARSNALKLENKWFEREHYAIPAMALIYEDVDLNLNKVSEVSMFHLYNNLKEKGGHLLLTAKTPPSKWALNLKDLKSRLNTAIISEIGLPDDQLMAAVLFKMFSDRQIFVTEKMLKFAINRMERSFSSMRKFVDMVDNVSMSEKRKASVFLIKSVIETMEIETLNNLS